VHGTGAALGDAAAVFGAGEADLLPEHPQQRGAGVDIDLMSPSIDVESSHIASPPIGSQANLNADETHRYRRGTPTEVQFIPILI
jgi:hypothetical protein